MIKTNKTTVTGVIVSIIIVITYATVVAYNWTESQLQAIDTYLRAKGKLSVKPEKLVKRYTKLTFRETQRTSYPWPIKPFNEQHMVIGVIDECRSTDTVARAYFNDGIDIDDPKDSVEVYPVANGFITKIEREGDFPFVEIKSDTTIEFSWQYGLLDDIPSALKEGDFVIAGFTVLGKINTDDKHTYLHFRDGSVDTVYVNPLRDGGIYPFVDAKQPVIESIELFQNHTANPISSDSVWGKVDIVVTAYDSVGTDNVGGAEHCGVYKLNYEIFDIDENSIEKNEHLVFDLWLDDQYITNVYAEGSSTEQFKYIVTNTYDNDENMYWDTSSLPDGDYIVRVRAYDLRRTSMAELNSEGVDSLDLIVSVKNKTAISVAQFYATWCGETIRVSWEIYPQNINTKGFNLYRCITHDGVYELLAYIPYTNTDFYTFLDKDVLPMAPYFYKLGVIDYNNSEIYVGPINVAAVSTTMQIDNVVANHSYPNPFTDVTNIAIFFTKSYNIPLEIKIYTITGELIKTTTLIPNTQFTYIWDGISDNGYLMSNSMYILKINSGQYTRVQKLMFIK